LNKNNSVSSVQKQKDYWIDFHFLVLELAAANISYILKEQHCEMMNLQQNVS